MFGPIYYSRSEKSRTLTVVSYVSHMFSYVSYVHVIWTSRFRFGGCPKGLAASPEYPASFSYWYTSKPALQIFFFFATASHMLKNCFPFAWSCCREDKTTHFTSLFLFWHCEIYIYILLAKRSKLAGCLQRVETDTL